jgi:hypothetical protein
MSAIKTYTLAAAIASAVLFVGTWLDGGPSDTDTQRAVAADLRDAKAQARRAVAALEVCDGRPFNWNGDTITCYTGAPR